MASLTQAVRLACTLVLRTTLSLHNATTCGTISYTSLPARSLGRTTFSDSHPCSSCLFHLYTSALFAIGENALFASPSFVVGSVD